MRLDFFLITNKIKQDCITHSNIIINNIIKSDHKPIWLSVRNPWSTIRDTNIENIIINKINTKNRNKNSKSKVHKLFKEIHNKNIIVNIKAIKKNFDFTTLNNTIKIINEEFYDICNKVYGSKDNTKTKDPKEKNKELGTFKKAHKNIQSY